MSASPERVHALRLLRGWQQTGLPPEEDETWEQAVPLTRELVLGCLRHVGALDAVVGHLSRRPPDALVRPVLWTGLMQLLLLDGIADHAAVFETVEAAKRVGVPRPMLGYANGLLRNVVRNRDEIRAWISAQALDIRLSHPIELVDRWTRAFGAETAEKICAWNQERSHTWVRRTRLGAEAPVPAELAPHPRVEGFFQLPRGVSLVSLPGFAEGGWYAQDPSTSFAPALLDVQPGEKVLDACAAPGGKTSILADAMGEGGRGLVSLDPNPARFARLKDNLARLRLHAVDARCGDLSSLADERFDAILLDAPCSNTGVIQRRPDVRWRFDARQLRDLTALQRDLLDRAAGCAAPGGRVVYSTCSIEPEETTELVRNWIRDNPGWNLKTENLLIPGEKHCDGAYAALLVP
jgi:16S rRNA (cytosine967-C5)-methyltransferase